MKYKHKSTGEEAVLIETCPGFYNAGGEVVPKRFIEDSCDWEKAEELDYETLTINTSYNKIEIVSVKRLSDGEIFTLKDRFTCGGCGGAIDKFNVIDNTISIGICEFPLEDIKKVKFPLFTTYDNVDIFEGDKYYLVSNDFVLGYCSSFSEIDLSFNCFAQKENAEKYIQENEKRYSLNDVKTALEVERGTNTYTLTSIGRVLEILEERN